MDAKLTAAISTLNLRMHGDPWPDVRDAWNLVRSKLFALDSASWRVVDSYTKGALLARGDKDIAELRRIVEGQG